MREILLFAYSLHCMLHFKCKICHFYCEHLTPCRPSCVDVLVDSGRGNGFDAECSHLFIARHIFIVAPKLLSD